MRRMRWLKAWTPMSKRISRISRLYQTKEIWMMRLMERRPWPVAHFEQTNQNRTHRSGMTGRRS
jgi:hypothetical protein